MFVLFFFRNFYFLLHCFLSNESYQIERERANARKTRDERRGKVDREVKVNR